MLHKLGANDLLSALDRAVLQSKIATAKMLHAMLGKHLARPGASGQDEIGRAIGVFSRFDRHGIAGRFPTRHWFFRADGRTQQPGFIQVGLNAIFNE